MRKISYLLILGEIFYAAKTLAKRLGIPCGVVLYPRGYRISTFDCILAPAFDSPKPAPNVIPIPVNLVAADADFYAAGVKAFRERHPDTGRPAVAVIVGGPNKCSTMTPEWMRKQLDSIFADHRTENGDSTVQPEFWVTTSRRTPPEVEAVVDSFPFDYKLLYSKDHFNPIPAFVSLASHLYVTAESTGMLSEACSFGTAEVQAIFQKSKNRGDSFFRQNLTVFSEPVPDSIRMMLCLMAVLAYKPQVLPVQCHVRIHDVVRRDRINVMNNKTRRIPTPGHTVLTHSANRFDVAFSALQPR